MSEDPLPASARQARARATRARLLAAAMEAFAAHGVEGARVEDIVAAADASWGSFFRYFPRKTDVLLAVAAQRLARATDVVAQRRAERSDTRVRGLALAVFTELLAVTAPDTASPEAAVGVPAALNAAIIRQMGIEPARLAAMGEAGPSLQELLVDLVMVGQRTDEIRTDLTPALLAGILAISVLSCSTLLQARPGVRPEAAEQLLRIVFSTAWDGVGTQPASRT